MWFSGNFQPQGKTALIVGASQGLGAEIALQLYQQQCSVVLVARTAAKLAAQVDRIRSTIEYDNKQIQADYVACDVSNYADCEELWKTLEGEGHDPDYIFCCAGLSIPKLFGDLNGDELSAGLDTNYKTAVNVVHSGYKAVRAASSNRLEYKQRHIVLFSSVVAFYPFIGYAQYAPAKAALTSLLLILRQELGPFNYRVSCVFAGNFQSEGFEEEQRTKPAITKQIEGPSTPISAAKCSQIIFGQLDRGYDTVTTDLIGWLLGCSVLGTLPRSWGLLQVLVGFLFSLIAPVANWFVSRDIESFYKKEDEK